MEVRILKKTDREMQLEIAGEDHTLGNMIAKEALRHPSVEYAAYRIPHPLLGKLEISIVVKEGSDPQKVLVEVVDRLIEQIESFRKAVEEAIR